MSEDGASSEVSGGAMSVLWRKVIVSDSSPIGVASTLGISSVEFPDDATSTVTLSVETTEDKDS